MRGIKRKEGFSLIEVMIAMAVLMVGLLAVVGLFGTGFQALQVGDHRTVAAQMAQNKMEELRQSNPAQIINGQDSQQGMIRSWAAQPSEKDPGLWIVSVNVTWRNTQNQEQAVLLRSFLFY